MPLKKRAQAVLNDKSIDVESRAIIRYALETNDPWLAELVRRAEAREDIVDSLQTIEDSGTDEVLTLEPNAHTCAQCTDMSQYTLEPFLS